MHLVSMIVLALLAVALTVDGLSAFFARFR